MHNLEQFWMTFFAIWASDNNIVYFLYNRNFEYLNDGRGKFDYLSDKLNKDRTYLQITQNRHSTDLRHEDDYPRPIESTNR